MQQKQILEDQINHILASMDGEETQPLKPEEIETYHVYPTNGGILIVREDEEPEDNRTIETTLAKKKPDFPAYLLCIFYGFLILSCLAFSLSLAFFPPLVTVTIVAKSEMLTLSGTLQLGRLLSPLTISQSQTVPTTGKGHQDATSATGFLTLYNGEFQRVTIAAGTMLTGANGIQVITDQDVTIPAANPPRFGQGSISAHAVSPGIQGNIPAYAINQACCAVSVLAKNTTPFHGGQDERNFQTVAKSDIAATAATLKTTLSQSVPGAFQGQLKPNEQLYILPCSPTVTADHQAGQEATLVKVTVSQSCSAVAYNSQELEKKAAAFLSQQAATKLGTPYTLFGQVHVSVAQATVTRTTTPLVLVAFHAQGTWSYALTRAQQEHIKHLIAGKTKPEALQLLASVPGIEQASIRWDGFGDDTRVPKNPTNIHLLLFYTGA